LFHDITLLISIKKQQKKKTNKQTNKQKKNQKKKKKTMSTSEWSHRQGFRVELGRSRQRFLDFGVVDDL
jgi:hypothetical protein